MANCAISYGNYCNNYAAPVTTIGTINGKRYHTQTYSNGMTTGTYGGNRINLNSYSNSSTVRHSYGNTNRYQNGLNTRPMPRLITAQPIYLNR